MIVNPAEAQAIATACNWLLDNQAQAGQMVENGRQAVLNHYTWDEEQERLLAFYQSF